MRFEWDEAKAALNERKHGIGFALARRVFDDPHLSSRLDRSDPGEERWQSLGAIDATILLLVVHTWRDGDEEIVRIISARKASRHERRLYEAGSWSTDR